MGTFANESQDVSLFLGEDLIVYLVLAFGAALVAGNLAAILRPPNAAGAGKAPGRRGRPTGSTTDSETEADADERLERAPMGRSLVMAGIGLVAAIWALVSLLTK